MARRGSHAPSRTLGESEIETPGGEMVQQVQLDQQTCPGMYSQWISYPLSASALGIGFQNHDYAQNFWVSQMFISADGSYAFWQVNNTSLTDTYWWPYITIDVSEDFDPRKAVSEPTMRTQQIVK
jgi:hypothetical protein